MLQLVAVWLLIQAAVLQLVAVWLLIQAAVLQWLVVQLAKQHAVHQLVAAMLVVTAVATDVVAEAAASRCQSSVCQKSACQSCVAQRSACLSATSVAAADADLVHLVAQLASQAAVHQLQLHVLALATDINSAKGLTEAPSRYQMLTVNNRE